MRGNTFRRNPDFANEKVKGQILYGNVEREGDYQIILSKIVQSYDSVVINHDDSIVIKEGVKHVYIFEPLIEGEDVKAVINLIWWEM